MENSHLLPDDVLVNVCGEQRGRGQQGRVHGGHDSRSDGSDPDDRDEGGGEVQQGEGQDGPCVAPLVGGRQSVRSAVPVWEE